MKYAMEEKGMVTVEMAVLIPLITLVAAGTVFFFLFFLDMSAARGEAVRIADETAAAWKTNGELATGMYDDAELIKRKLGFLVTGEREALAKRAQIRLRNRTEERLSISRVVEAGVSIRAFQVRTRIRLIFRFPLASMEKFMGTFLEFSCETSSPVDCWEECLRAREGLQ